MSDKWCDYKLVSVSEKSFEFTTECGVQIQETKDSFKFLNFCPNCGRRVNMLAQDAARIMVKFFADNLMKPEELRLPHEVMDSDANGELGI